MKFYHVCVCGVCVCVRARVCVCGYLRLNKYLVVDRSNNAKIHV